MILNNLVERDQFYSDLTPVTNEMIATTTSSTTSALHTLSEITNILDGNSETSIDSQESILTDSDTSGTVLIISTTASPIKATTTTTSSTSNSIFISDSKKSTSSSTKTKYNNYAISSSTNAAPNFQFRNKKKETLIFGLLGSSFFLSLL